MGFEVVRGDIGGEWRLRVDLPHAGTSLAKGRTRGALRKVSVTVKYHYDRDNGASKVAMPSKLAGDTGTG